MKLPSSLVRRVGRTVPSRVSAWMSVVVSAACATSGARADLRLPPLFSDHAVLQRDKPLPVWGTATPGAPVSVRFAGQTAQATADDRGRWSVELQPLEASAEPRAMTVQSGESRIVVNDVLVGEVWLCGGQSNMEWPMSVSNGFDAAKRDVAAGHRRSIRALKMPHTMAEQVLETNDARWRATDEKSVGAITAVGWAFACELADRMEVPVGLLDINWGGTRIEPWMADGSMFRGMIGPVTPAAIRGALWYQGESNVEQADRYPEQLTQLIAAWRGAFRNPEMPFGIVQLASFQQPSDDPVQGGWSALRAAQAKVAATMPGTGLAVTLDVGDAEDIHPRDKATVGRRLAAWALANAYGHSVDTWSGPVVESIEQAMNAAGTKAIRVRFRHGEGLRPAAGTAIGGFAVAGPDGTFHWANATVDADAADPANRSSVLVSTTSVAEPVEIAYAWQNNPVRANLVNAGGFPAGPFRASVTAGK